MKLLLTRFSLFLVMMIGIAGASYVQGDSANHDDYAASAVACTDEIVALASAETLPVRKEKRAGAGQRLIRWQSLLPGTFR